MLCLLWFMYKNFFLRTLDFQLCPPLNQRTGLKCPSFILTYLHQRSHQALDPFMLSWSLRFLLACLPSAAQSMQLLLDCFPYQHPRAPLQRSGHTRDTSKSATLDQPHGPPSLPEKIAVSPSLGPLSRSPALGGPWEPLGSPVFFSPPRPSHTPCNLCSHCTEKVESP